jgi:RNA polymerase sigma-70 factor (ECF subfamily)
MGVEEAIAHIPRLRRYARLLTGDAARADDLVQDTLERACRKWSLWRPHVASRSGDPLRGWLLTLMHHLHLNQRRDYRYDDGHDEIDVLNEPQHEPLAVAADRLDLERALQGLPASQREVLLLVTVEDLSYAEVARVLDIPIGTVMSRLSRAREHLRLSMSGAAPVAPRTPLKVVK